jgi:hypothetical protein
MVIVFGTPRAGTTFVVNWIANNNPAHTLMVPDDFGELFQPYFYTTTDVEKETIRRMALLTDRSIFKLHTGAEMSTHIWELIKSRPVVAVRRADVLGQFISYGLGNHTDKWVTYNDNSSVEIPQFCYKKEWFDDLASRLIEFDNRYSTLNVVQTIWYEDIPNMPLNGKLPKKQSNGTTIDKMKSIANRNNFINWYND